MAPRASSPDALSNARDPPINDKWAVARARTRQVSQYASHSTSELSSSSAKQPGLFRRLSESLPQWHQQTARSRTATPRNSSTPSRLLRKLRSNRPLSTLLSAVFLFAILFLYIPSTTWYRRSLWFGGGARYVIILASNPGGGVMEWKGPREWAIERDSIKNKQQYAAKWGYDLEIVDMAIKKRYAHEWRESWEKVDVLRRCMFEYPQAEWFWWLDLNTFIMEPERRLQEHVFGELDRIGAEDAGVYRDVNVYNPLEIQHPPKEPWLDEVSRNANGDMKASSVNMLIPQDCSGFNLGSFFVKRSEWTNRVMDIWWDPVHYEQRHMEWEHKEQDAFEYLYANQPWIRSGVAFIKQRKVNSFPDGACGENDPNIHYREHDRDFVVNMAGCEWGRDCWGEMFRFRELSRKLNRTWWRKLLGWFGGEGGKDRPAPDP